MVQQANGKFLWEDVDKANLLWFALACAVKTEVIMMIASIASVPICRSSCQSRILHIWRGKTKSQVNCDHFLKNKRSRKSSIFWPDPIIKTLNLEFKFCTMWRRGINFTVGHTKGADPLWLILDLLYTSPDRASRWMVQLSVRVHEEIHMYVLHHGWFWQWWQHQMLSTHLRLPLGEIFGSAIISAS